VAASLRKHIFPTLGNVPVSAIDTPLVLKALQPIWSEIPVAGTVARSTRKALGSWQGRSKDSRSSFSRRVFSMAMTA
jgi:hypothetical protein